MVFPFRYGIIFVTMVSIPAIAEEDIQSRTQEEISCADRVRLLASVKANFDSDPNDRLAQILAANTTGAALGGSTAYLGSRAVESKLLRDRLQFSRDYKILQNKVEEADRIRGQKQVDFMEALRKVPNIDTQWVNYNHPGTIIKKENFKVAPDMLSNTEVRQILTDYLSTHGSKPSVKPVANADLVDKFLAAWSTREKYYVAKENLVKFEARDDFKRLVRQGVVLERWPYRGPRPPVKDPLPDRLKSWPELGRRFVTAGGAVLGAGLMVAGLKLVQSKCGTGVTAEQSTILGKYVSVSATTPCMLTSKGAAALARAPNQDLEKLCQAIPDLPMHLQEMIGRHNTNLAKISIPTDIDMNCGEVGVDKLSYKIGNKSYAFERKTSGQFSVKLNDPGDGQSNAAIAQSYVVDYDPKANSFGEVKGPNIFTDETRPDLRASTFAEFAMDLQLSPTDKMDYRRRGAYEVGESLVYGAPLIQSSQEVCASQISQTRPIDAVETKTRK